MENESFYILSKVDYSSLSINNDILILKNEYILYSIINNSYIKVGDVILRLEKTNRIFNFRLKTINGLYLCNIGRNIEYIVLPDNHSCESIFLILNANFIDYDHEVVISRYSENLHWTKYLPQNIITIYNKGNEISKCEIEEESLKRKRQLNIMHIPNIGREGHTYLYHIMLNYNNLCKRTTFLQGNSLEHSPDLLELLYLSTYYTSCQSLSLYYNRFQSIPPFEIENKYTYNIFGARYAVYRISDDLQIPGFVDVGITEVQKHYARKYSTKHIISHFLNKTFEKNIKNNDIPFAFSGLFSVLREKILSYESLHYKRVCSELLSENDQGSYHGYILERCWLYLFSS